MFVPIDWSGLRSVADASQPQGGAYQAVDLLSRTALAAVD
jgi:hypothetical protein